MAASVANSRKALTSGANTTTCASFTSTTGDTIYVTVSDASGQGGLTITDNKGNTYTQVGTTQTSSLGGSQLRRYVCQNANGGSGHTVTAMWASNSDAVVIVYDLTGVAAASLDKSAQADDNSMPWSVTSPTLSQADEIAISASSGSWSGTFSESTGFTIDQQEGNNSLYWTSAAGSKVVSATTALTPSWSVSGGGSGSAVSIDTFKAAAAGGVTGTVAWTEANDTASIAGSLTVSGSLAWTEANDTASLTGSATVSGSTSWTEANDSASLSGTLTVSGSISWTEANDTSSITGNVGSTVSGPIAWTEADDAASLTGALAVGGALTWVEEADSWSIAAQVQQPANGVIAWVESDDAWFVAGTSAAQVAEPVSYPGPKRKKKPREKWSGVPFTRIYHEIEPEVVEVIEKAAEQAAMQQKPPSKKRAISYLNQFGIYQESLAKVLIEIEHVKREQREEEDLAVLVAYL